MINTATVFRGMRNFEPSHGIFMFSWNVVEFRTGDKYGVFWWESGSGKKFMYVDMIVA